MAKGVLNHWPSFLLTIVLFIGIVACFRRLDYLVIDEVKALISILFGFATTCLLLSYIWIIQRRPLTNRPWPNQAFAFGSNVPSMHPRGRMESIDSDIVDHSTNIEHPIAIIELDRPPTYEDAIIYSKPVNQDLQTGQAKEKNQDMRQRNGPSTTSVTQIALNIVRTFTHTDQNNNHSDDGQNNQAASSRRTNTATTTTTGEAMDPRKISYVQLDVNQLLMSSSPPRYSEIMIGALARGGSVQNSTNNK